MKVADLKVKIYADGADLEGMLEMYRLPHIKGFTTNPTLMKKANVLDYVEFAQQVVAQIPDRSISFEVFADEFDQMEVQALKIKDWGENVYIKIPVMNTKQEPAYDLIERLWRDHRNAADLLLLVGIQHGLVARVEAELHALQ